MLFFSFWLISLCMTVSSFTPSLSSFMSVSESGDPACLFPIMWLYGSYCSVMPQLGKTLVILVTGRRQLIDSCLDHLLSIQFISRSTSVPGCAGPWDTVFSLIAPLMRWVQQVKRQPQQKQQALHCALPLIIMFVFLPIWERFLWWSKVPFPLLSFPNSNFLRNIYSITISTNRFLPLIKGFFLLTALRANLAIWIPSVVLPENKRAEWGGQSLFLPFTLILCISVRRSKIERTLLNITYGVEEYFFWYFYI